VLREGDSVGRVDDYRGALRELPAEEWDEYLMSRSGLPGPRGNLELIAAVAAECPGDRLRRYTASSEEFLAACGAVGLGRLAIEGDDSATASLRQLAPDPRWRVREGVAMGLQLIGDHDLARMLRVARAWATDPSPLVQRAAVAGVCEPRLLTERGVARDVLDILDSVTGDLAGRTSAERRDADVRVLRKALGYCWSVAVAAEPDEGFARLERWAAADDRDVRWVVRENLKKARLHRADPERFDRLRERIGTATG